MKYKLQTAKYLFADLIAAASSWTLFYIFRKEYIEPLKFGYDIPLTFSDRYFLGLILIPISWVLLYYLTGYYRDIYRKSRLNDIVQTFLQSLFGVTILFFLLLLDDEISSYKNYYQLYSVLFGLHFLICLILRLIITSITARKIQNKKIRFNTLMIGSNKQAVETYLELEQQKLSYGNYIIGFVNVIKKDHYQLSDYIKHYGSLNKLSTIIQENDIQEVIIALESSENTEIGKIMNKLAGCKVIIKAIPNMYDILTGKVKMTQLFGTPLIQISHDLMPVWQSNVKQIIDYVFSLLALVISLPLIIILAIGVKLSSPGKIFYSHERIGRYGKSFKILKFRSMRDDAEKNGPMLSNKNDSRLTKFGSFMRKYRLDEIPNFINVLKGDMSLVGPRPERQFYIDQIIKKAPHYVHLQKVKPGITSWGQVKYGYAENVDQMIKRLRYDILYIENMSLFVDMKIIFYTILTIINGRGV
ncbi:MAG: sugar transferase [Bacteroidales bacterium]|nr:sugar transferase [Bacteroidales bacterium]MCF8389275.1 sugar transferase [Bacteroidales bacterium]